MKFTLPDVLPTDRVELDALAAQAADEIAVFQARHKAANGDDDEFTPDEVDRFEYLAQAGQTLAEAIGAIDAAEADKSSRLASLIERTAPKADDPAMPAEAEADEPEPAADAPDDGDGGAEVVAAAEAATKEAAQPVSASAKISTSFAAATKSDVPDVTPDASDGNHWRLASTAPNFAEHDGQLVDTFTIAEGIANQSGAFTGFPDGKAVVLANADRPQGPLVTTAEEFLEELERVTSTVPGQEFSAEGLTAAGGWCAPSVQLFGFDPTNPAQGLLSLPEMNIPRGGIIVPDEPDFASLITAGLAHYTEAELEADSGSPNYTPTVTKPIVEIPCVENMTEYRKEALVWGVKTGILQKRAWPELIKKFLDEFMVAHQQRISTKTLTKILAKSSAAKTVPTDVVLGATGSILNGLHQRAVNIQLKRRTKTIGGIAPYFLRHILRADLAMRDGLDALDVTDADVDRWLAARDIYLQYEGLWQSLGTGQPGHADTNWWPGSVDVVLFPAGAFWRTLGNIVTVGASFDLDLLTKNRELVGFVEDEFQVGIKPGDVGYSHLIRIPLCVNGAVGARESIDCTTEYATTKTATFNFPGTPTGGGATFKFSGQPDKPSSSIAYNASTGNVDTALTGIDDDVTDISVSGGPLPGTAVTVTYPARLGDLQLGTNSLTGGTQPGAGVPIT